MECGRTNGRIQSVSNSFRHWFKTCLYIDLFLEYLPIYPLIASGRPDEQPDKRIDSVSHLIKFILSNSDCYIRPYKLNIPCSTSGGEYKQYIGTK